MAQIAMGEKLAAEGNQSLPIISSISDHSVGPQSYLPSAMAFFRALRVYPAPVELIVIYEKTIVEPVFKVGSTFRAIMPHLDLLTAHHGTDSTGRK